MVAVPCQSVCEGPVAGAVVAGRLQWFGRMGTTKAQRALVRVTAAARAELPGPLVKRRVAKRAGKLRG